MIRKTSFCSRLWINQSKKETHLLIWLGSFGTLQILIILLLLLWPRWRIKRERDLANLTGIWEYITRTVRPTWSNMVKMSFQPSTFRRNRWVSVMRESPWSLLWQDGVTAVVSACGLDWPCTCERFRSAGNLVAMTSQDTSEKVITARIFEPRSLTVVARTHVMVIGFG